MDAEVKECVFYDNEVAFRVRGPDIRGGAQVSIVDCAIYDTQLGVRAEDKIEQLKISGIGFGSGVGDRIRFVNGKAGAGYVNTAEHEAPAMDILLKSGFWSRSR